MSVKILWDFPAPVQPLCLHMRPALLLYKSGYRAAECRHHLLWSPNILIALAMASNNKPG